MVFKLKWDPDQHRLYKTDGNQIHCEAARYSIVAIIIVAADGLAPAILTRD